MTERGQPSMDGSPACPFVAFEHDRDARADRPDHRHRCYAEPDPAPRAAAHQEAYCLSSAFPVCPTFQAWARREAAQARSDREAASATATAAASAAGAAAANASGAGGASTGAGETTAGAGARDAGEEWPEPPPATGQGDGEEQAGEWVSGSPPADVPIESTPRRNPPRDWAAPPPWASASSPAGSAPRPAASGSSRPGGSAGSTAVPPEAQGLAGSAADRLASGASIADAVPAPPGQGGPPGGSPSGVSSARTQGSRSADLPSAAPDPELAGLVGGATRSGGRDESAAASLTDEERIAAGYPPPTRTGRRPPVSSTRAAAHERDRPPQREHVQHDGPSWERSRRHEAYPTIKSRPGFGGVPPLPRVAVLAGALGIAAVALFFLPALLGIGGGDESGSPIPSATAEIVTPPPSPTPVPEPTPQVYVIKQGDNLSSIARSFDITLDELLAANKDTIENPDLIAVGDEIIIPAPPPEEVPASSAEESSAP